MLWVPCPSSETFAADSCCHLYTQSDAGSLTSSLHRSDLGFFKLGKNCGSQRCQSWDLVTACLKSCRQANGKVSCNLHRCVDAQASWRGTGVVLESMSRSSGRTLEAQLTEVRFGNSSAEVLTRRLVTKDLLDGSRSNAEKRDVQDSDAESEAEEKSRNFGSDVSDAEEKRPLVRPEDGDHSSQMDVKLTSIRTPAYTPGLSVSRSMVNETILYLESFGVDCSRAISQEPRVVDCNIHRVRRLVHALENYGLKRNELGRIINTCPNILHLTAENNLKPVVNFLIEEVSFPRAGLSKLIKRCPRLLAYSVDEQLRPTLFFLRTLGFSRIGGIITSNPTLLTCSVEKNLVPKLKFLESLGLSYKETASMVIRFPAIFNYSIKENLQPKYDYLVNEMGGYLEDLLAFPQYFGYSLENRIKPRHQHFTEHNICVSLPTMLKLSEVEFISRFKSSKPEQPPKVAVLLDKAGHVNFNGTVLKRLTMTDFRESGTPVLMGATRS